MKAVVFICASPNAKTFGWVEHSVWFYCMRIFNELLFRNILKRNVSIQMLIQTHHEITFATKNIC